MTNHTPLSIPIPVIGRQQRRIPASTVSSDSTSVDNTGATPDKATDSGIADQPTGRELATNSTASSQPKAASGSAPVTSFTGVPVRKRQVRTYALPPEENPDQAKSSTKAPPVNQTPAATEKPPAPRQRRSGLSTGGGHTGSGYEPPVAHDGGKVDRSLHDEDYQNAQPSRRENYARGSSATSRHDECPFPPDEPGAVPELNWAAIGGDPAEHAMVYTEPDYHDPRLPSSPPPPHATYNAVMTWLCEAEPPEVHDALVEDEDCKAFVIDLIAGKRPDIYAYYDNVARKAKANNGVGGPS